ncbi:hypothetical protein [Streptomyces europaeiscabiei]|uniref:hypothetical protein n=1 Tax=Streptomyces europaeiscabiei TaxID=146819 RepID=UPI002E101C90|nr:hypothetical protein OHB30_23710 [Streptomyces europaeiscabiei]
MLPLHTADYHGTADGPVPLTALDRVVSSCTLTVRATAPAEKDGTRTTDPTKPARTAPPPVRRTLARPRP